MHNFRAPMMSTVCGVCIANASSQELPAATIEIRASTFVSKRLGEVLVAQGKDFGVTLRRENDRTHSLRYSRQPEELEMLIAVCMALQVATDSGFAAVVLVQEKDAQLVEYLKTGEASAGGSPSRSAPIRIDSPDPAGVIGRCNALKGPK